MELSICYVQNNKHDTNKVQTRYEPTSSLESIRTQSEYLKSTFLLKIQVYSTKLYRWSDLVCLQNLQKIITFNILLLKTPFHMCPLLFHLSLPLTSYNSECYNLHFPGEGTKIYEP